jgi:hypothetical protein
MATPLLRPCWGEDWVPRSVREPVARGLDSKGAVTVGAAAADADADDDQPLTLVMSPPGAAYIAAYMLMPASCLSCLAALMSECEPLLQCWTAL